MSVTPVLFLAVLLQTPPGVPGTLHQRPTIASVLGQSDPEFARRSSVQRQGLFSGTALRIVVTTHTLEEPNTVTTQRIEIAGLESATFERSLWDIPAGLRRREGEFSWRF